jgi:hypothetical protein
MPVVKVEGGWKAWEGSPTVHPTREAAVKQLQAIEISKHRREAVVRKLSEGGKLGK